MNKAMKRDNDKISIGEEEEDNDKLSIAKEVWGVSEENIYRERDIARLKESLLYFFNTSRQVAGCENSCCN